MNPRDKIKEILKTDRSNYSRLDPHTISNVFDLIAKDRTLLSEVPEGQHWHYHEALFVLGMPRDMVIVSLLWSAANYSEKFSKFAILFSGVVALDEDLSKGKTGAELSMDRGHFQFVVHLWKMVLLHKDTTAQLTLIYNSNCDPTATRKLYDGKVGWIPKIDGFRMDSIKDLDLLREGYCLLESPEKIKALIDAGKRGGARNVKVSDKPQNIKEALGEEYVKLRDALTNVKQDAKVVSGIMGNEWRTHILKKYPVLKNHPDLLERVDPYGVPSNPDASDGRAPWQIAIEIAAREVIPGYKNNSTSADALKKAAIIPKEED
jgi:hypothetical protein